MDTLFLHGWAFSSKVFSAVEGIKPDLPGHGNNKDRYRGFEKLAEDIAFRLPAKYRIVGWSLGGSLALILALKFPAKVKELVLIGTSPFFGGAWDERNLRAFKLRVKKEGVAFFRKLAFPKPFEDTVELSVCLRMLEDYIRLDLRNALPYLKSRVFVIHGENDSVVPVEDAFKLHTLIKDSKLIILPGGHFPFENERSLLSTVLKVRSNL